MEADYNPQDERKEPQLPAIWRDIAADVVAAGIRVAGELVPVVVCNRLDCSGPAP